MNKIIADRLKSQAQAQAPDALRSGPGSGLLVQGGVVTGSVTIPPGGNRIEVLNSHVNIPSDSGFAGIGLYEDFRPMGSVTGAGTDSGTGMGTGMGSPKLFTSIDEAFSQYDELKATLSADDDLIQKMQAAAALAHQKAIEADENVAGANKVKQNDLESYQELLGNLIEALQGELARVTPPPTPTTATT